MPYVHYRGPDCGVVQGIVGGYHWEQHEGRDGRDSVRAQSLLVDQEPERCPRRTERLKRVVMHQEDLRVVLRGRLSEPQGILQIHISPKVIDLLAASTWATRHQGGMV